MSVAQTAVHRQVPQDPGQLGVGPRTHRPTNPRPARSAPPRAHADGAVDFIAAAWARVTGALNASNIGASMASITGLRGGSAAPRPRRRRPRPARGSAGAARTVRSRPRHEHGLPSTIRSRWLTTRQLAPPRARCPPATGQRRQRFDRNCRRRAGHRPGRRSLDDGRSAATPLPRAPRCPDPLLLAGPLGRRGRRNPGDSARDSEIANLLCVASRAAGPGRNGSEAVMDHAEAEQSLGSYVLGALDASDRAAVEEHLKTCVGCRAELVTFAGLPGLMGRLTAQEAQDGRLRTRPPCCPPPSPRWTTRSSKSIDGCDAGGRRPSRPSVPPSLRAPP